MALLRFGVRPHLDMQQLCDNPKFKGSIRDEIQQCRDHPELNALVRHYIESFSRIHESVRGVLRDPTSEWRAAFLSAFERTASALPGRAHVDVIRYNNEHEILERIAVVRELLDRINELERRNTSLPTLGRWYVSNEIC